MTVDRAPRLGLVIDHPKRDLAGAVMLARALTEHGIEVALIPLYDQALDVPLLGLDGLIVNFAREVNKPLVAAYRAMGLPVWVLDTEGGVLAEEGGNAPDSLAAYIRDSGYAELLTGYFFWGPVLREAFARTSGMAADRLHVTGCPRFDFAAPRWRAMLSHERKGFILFNANFSLVNPRFARSPDEEVTALTANGWGEAYVRALIADMLLVLADFQDVVIVAARAYPDRTFVVRPHPFENDQLYRDRFANCGNVIVDGRGSVLDVIANASAVVHLNCGTAIESVLLGKVPFSMEFLNRERTRQHATLPSRVSRPVTALDELLVAFDQLEAEQDAFDFAAVHGDHIAPWFHWNDGGAADRIATIVAMRLRSARSRRLGAAAAVRRSVGNLRNRPSPAQLVQGGFANLLGSRRVARIRARFQSRRRDKLFGEAEVRKIAAEFEQGGKAFAIDHARHPLTRAPMSSLLFRRRSQRPPAR